MKIAVMQPYFFPYIGYFQLLNAVSKFIIYDDVTFIKGGWINRNRVLVEGGVFMLSVPIQALSSYKLIKETQKIADQRWTKKTIRTLEQSYHKAPFFSHILPIVKKVLYSEEQCMGKVALISLMETCNYLGVNTEIIESSVGYGNSSLKGQERVLDICIKEGASQYWNPIGGKDLYSKEEFTKKSIQLKFMKPKMTPYRQFNKVFVPDLSIIDVMMFNDPEKIREFLDRYEVM